MSGRRPPHEPSEGGVIAYQAEPTLPVGDLGGRLSPQGKKAPIIRFILV
jgi:hypothetical protein